MESEYIRRTGQLKEYIKLHIISLEQDLEGISEQMESLDPASKDYNELDFEYNHMAGQILNARHFLSVANDILAETNEEE
jgi:hypothetical protein